jgi:RNA polymerase sigma-70 factor (ECF subfamily)
MAKLDPRRQRSAARALRPQRCMLTLASPPTNQGWSMPNDHPDLPDVDDEALMARYQTQGDLSAFETLFARHRIKLFRYILRLSRAPTIADEVSQQAWLKVIEVARTQGYAHDSTASFRTWLYTLARNFYVDMYVRAHGVSRTTLSAEPRERESGAIDQLSSVDQCVDRERLGDLLEQAMDRLPEEQREVVILWAQGHPLGAVAQIFGVPWATVVSRKKYAIAKLRAALAVVGVTSGDV